MQEILKKFVEAYYLEEREDKDLQYSDSVLPGERISVTGQLKEFYDHLFFRKECFFFNTVIDLDFYPSNSEGRSLEAWALDDGTFPTKFSIFASNSADDIVLCNTDQDECPVFFMRSGDDLPTQITASLEEFLSFYVHLIRLILIKWHDATYATDYKYKPEVKEDVAKLIEAKVSEPYRANMLRFIF